MGVKEFQEFLEKTKKEFGERLQQDGDLMKELYGQFLLNAFDQCTSKFEEETLIENLQQVYGEYLREYSNY